MLEAEGGPGYSRELLEKKAGAIPKYKTWFVPAALALLGIIKEPLFLWLFPSVPGGLLLLCLRTQVSAVVQVIGLKW